MQMLLVMDYMEGGPVMTREALERGRCIPEPLALQYFRDMCKARPTAAAAPQMLRASCMHACSLLLPAGWLGTAWLQASDVSVGAASPSPWPCSTSATSARCVPVAAAGLCAAAAVTQRGQ